MFSSENISILYDPINEQNTFSSGDTISGRVILDLAEETEINYLSVKAKGKAEVLWSETLKDETVTYHAKEKYFKLAQYILQKQQKDSKIVTAGIHEYSFTFQIPEGKMPISFKGDFGKNIYTLEAKLSRAVRMKSKAKAEFTFLPKDVKIGPELMSPQFASKEKSMKLFTYGNVYMNISTEKMGYLQGEDIRVTAVIENKSSRTVVPKFVLYQKQSFFARGKRKLSINPILKQEGDPINSSVHQTVTKTLKMPVNLSMSILTFPILKVEYRLKVYLDIPMAKDLEVKLPLIILPAPGSLGPMTQPS
ncbi:hypothetical protein AGOR_G00006130 [Albula goreensis]|uniref:Arrestin C-terminal-like domain-containing protein n=1 Tax=Albula goreensis TaxID=1534307 RepID=A0A8T3E8G4_9TELE|nr:hypothetical protein AGOR_G00006130 [Albula goreensis]